MNDLGPLLLHEQHEGVQWLFDVRLFLLRILMGHGQFMVVVMGRMVLLLRTIVDGSIHRKGERK